VGAGRVKSDDIVRSASTWNFSSAPTRPDLLDGLQVVINNSFASIWIVTGFGVNASGGVDFISVETLEVTAFVTGELAPIPEPIPLDIKPRRCPNRLNVRRHRPLHVAILGTADFDVTQIDRASIRLEGVPPVRSAVKDVATPFEPFVGKESRFACTREGPDGFDDLNLNFRTTQDVVAALGHDVSHGDVLVLELTASLDDGTPIVGEDVVVIVKNGDLRESR